MHKKYSLLIAFVLVALNSCKLIKTPNNQPILSNTMKQQTDNPMICNTDSGICTPNANTEAIENSLAAISSQTEDDQTKRSIKIVYFTDPICSACWGIEAQLKKLKLEYAQNLQIEYVMGGLLPSWDVYNSGGISKPADVASHWDEVAPHYQMPIDGDLWLEDPLPSSIPPSLAFIAAQEQDPKKALVFLRKIKEMVFLEKKNICRWQHIEQAAIFAKLNPIQLKKDYESTQIKDTFRNGITKMGLYPVRGFPTLVFENNENKRQSTVSGAKEYNQFEQAIQNSNPTSEPFQKKSYPKTHTFLFNEFSTLTTKEYAVLKEISFETAKIELENLLKSQFLTVKRIKNGELWSKAN